MQAVDSIYGIEQIEKSWRLITELPVQVVIQPRQKEF